MGAHRKTISALAGLCLLAVAASPPSGRVRLAWDYEPTELSTNLTFVLRHSTSIATPLTNWLVLTNVVGTNLTIEVQITPGQHYFVLTASNFWGESDFSNVAGTPPLPRSAVNLRVARGD